MEGNVQTVLSAGDWNLMMSLQPRGEQVRMNFLFCADVFTISPIVYPEVETEKSAESRFFYVEATFID